MGVELVRYDAARRALAAAHRIDEVKSIRDKSMAMEVYAKQAKDGELIAHAIEIRKRAERRLGEIMKGPKAKGGGDKRSKHRVRKRPGDLPSLADHGIDKHLADRARKAAALPEAKFEAAVSRAVATGVAAAENEQAVIKAARAMAVEAKLANRAVKHAKIRDAARANSMNLGDRRFPLIYADPPWEFKTYTDAGGMRSPANHYPTLPLDEIIAFTIGGRPVREVATDDAALFLWCTSANMEWGLRVIEGWGFTFKAGAVWVKDKIGTGQIFRNRHELLLYGSRGKFPGPIVVPESVFEYPRSEHSTKPPQIRATIEGMYPAFGEQSRLELFARGSVAGWTTHGYEAAQQLQAAE